MFTGLIEGQGQVVAVEKQGGDVRFRFRPLFEWNAPKIGESVACNGVCLTVETWLSADPEFTAFASEETLSCSNLKDLSPGSLVNMERAMIPGQRVGGHIVSGHVDTVARVERITRVGQSHRVRLSFDPVWNSQIVSKGSVALDGISLTVNACGAGFIEVNVIPETWRVTTAARWGAGSAVNLETDIIGKYVDGLTAPYRKEDSAESRVTMDLLRRTGFSF